MKVQSVQIHTIADGITCTVILQDGDIYRMQVFQDGSAWCATKSDFVNLQESPAGFGGSPLDALNVLFRQLHWGWK